MVLPPYPIFSDFSPVLRESAEQILLRLKLIR